MGKIKIAVMISGEGTNLQALIDKIHYKNIGGEIALVLSDRKNIYGLRRAEKANIKTLIIDHRKHPLEERKKLLLQALQENHIDLIVLAGYLDRIPDQVTRLYQNRIINIHPSLIPSFSGKGYYGRQVHQAVLERGVKITGATVHFVNEEIDEGPIIIQKAVEVDEKDTVDSLQNKVLSIEHEILPLAVQLFIEGRLGTGEK